MTESGKWEMGNGGCNTGIAVVLAAFLAGCATVGPQISKQEIEQARKELQRKALEYKFSQTLRLNQLGRRLLTRLPMPKENRPKPYVGLLLSDVTSQLKEFYGLDFRSGIIVTGVVPGGPADEAGFHAGDRIVKVDGIQPKSAWEAEQRLRKLNPGESTPVEIRTGEETLVADLVPASAPYWIRFSAVEKEEVNAFASPEQVVVTYGMLRFIHSDDELAVVLGHELAHLTQGHIAKSMGSGILAGILGLTVGAGSDVLLPGSGDVAARLGGGAVRAQFSREFEREADYLGLQYAHAAGFDIRAGVAVWERFGVEIPQTLSANFLSEHPPSPERMIRVQRVVEELL